MNYCVRNDRKDMCPKFQKRRCIQSKYYQDGLFKKEDARLSNLIIVNVHYIRFNCKNKVLV